MVENMKQLTNNIIIAIFLGLIVFYLMKCAQYVCEKNFNCEKSGRIEIIINSDLLNDIPKECTNKAE